MICHAAAPELSFSSSFTLVFTVPTLRFDPLLCDLSDFSDDTIILKVSLCQNHSNRAGCHNGFPNKAALQCSNRLKNLVDVVVLASETKILAGGPPICAIIQFTALTGLTCAVNLIVTWVTEPRR